MYRLLDVVMADDVVAVVVNEGVGDMNESGGGVLMTADVMMMKEGRGRLLESLRQLPLHG